MDDDGQIVPGTAIARGGRGVLIRGPSGSGKSDLALRAITCPIRLPGEPSQQPFELISDDQTRLRALRGTVLASAPAVLHGKLEVRGVGIVVLAAVGEVALALVVDLVTGLPERMPHPAAGKARLLGRDFDHIAIRPFEASAPAKIAMALKRASTGALYEN